MVFKRLRDITVATINEGLDQIENPVAMLNQYMRDLEYEIAKAEKAVIKQVTMEKKFEQMVEETKEMAAKRNKQAEIALASGEEQLARKAVAEKLRFEQKVVEYSNLYQTASAQVQELKEQLAEMKEKFYGMRDRKYELMARANSVKTKQQMNTTMARFDHESAAKGFARIEERIIEMETRAAVQQQTQYESFDRKVVMVENNELIDQELEKLRQEKVKN